MVNIFLVLTIMIPGLANLKLSQKDVAERVLGVSNQAQETRWTTEAASFARATIAATYDWTLSAESGYELTRIRNFQGTANPQDENYKTLITLRKPFQTGTTILTSLTRTSIQSRTSANSVFSMPSQQTQDVLGISLEQNLWRNFFGQSDRTTVLAAEKSELAARTMENNQLQALILDGIRLFWRTYVSQETFKESVLARDRYQELVDVVRKKSALGYVNPGELAQVQAELEQRNQTVKMESMNFLQAQDQLLTLIKIDKIQAGSVEFNVATELPPLPALNTIDPRKLHEAKANQLKLEAAEASLSASRARSKPELSFVANYNISGLAQTPADATQELVSGQFPKYYYGLKFSYNFGSDIFSEDIKNKTLARNIQKSVVERRLNELQDELAAAERKVQSSYAVAESVSKQKQLRESAARDLQRAFSQGRTDVRFLIDAMNTYYSTLVQFKRAVGDYQIALNEWSAIRDELLTEIPMTEGTTK